MNNNFHIYVTTLNEEYLIRYTVEALLKVFPHRQISVIDLGSEDKTLEKIPKGIAVISKSLLPGEEAGRRFTSIKNEYSKCQEWVMWVDGDEIYPTSTLLRISSWLNEAQDNKHSQKALRSYWRILRYTLNKEIVCSNEYQSAGPKLFNSEAISYRRSWPRERSGRSRCSRRRLRESRSWL